MMARLRKAETVLPALAVSLGGQARQRQALEAGEGLLPACLPSEGFITTGCF